MMPCIIRLKCLYKKNNHYENKFNFNIFKDDSGEEYIKCSKSEIISKEVGKEIIECAKLFNNINLSMKAYKRRAWISLNKYSFKYNCSCKGKFQSFPYDSLEENQEIKCILCGNTLAKDDYLKIIEAGKLIQDINEKLKENNEYSISLEMSYRPENASICAHDFKEGKDLKFHHLFLIEYK